MEYKQIITDLKNRIYFPIYFLSGEEPYYIDQISDFIEEHVLTDVEKEFNQMVVYGQDVTVREVVSLAKRYPMMASHQVVIVKEAQHFDKLDDLSGYINNPLKSTLLVINYKFKKVDRRKQLYKAIESNGVLFESKKLYDNQIIPWIQDYVGQRGYRITPKAVAMLVEFLGNDLSKIVNEINKLILNLPGGGEINDLLVERNIGISKDFNIFELQNAIGSKQVLKANRIINYFAANPKENPLVKTITMLYSFFSKLLIYHQLKDRSKNSVAAALSISQYFVKDYEIAARNYNINRLNQVIGYLREYDLKSKGYGNASTSDGELARELLYKILH